MRDFKKRRTIAGELLRVGLGIAGVALLCEAADARAAAEAQLAALGARHTAVAADVAALSSERGLEAEVRERYGVARPGEAQIDIVRQAPQEEPIVEHPTLWDRLWRLLFVW